MGVVYHLIQTWLEGAVAIVVAATFGSCTPEVLDSAPWRLTDTHHVMYEVGDWCRIEYRVDPISVPVEFRDFNLFDRNSDLKYALSNQGVLTAFYNAEPYRTTLYIGGIQHE